MPNLKTLICCIIFISLRFVVDAQIKKEILGTFEIGCKVFNYNFTKNSNGIYSFRLEFAETESLIYSGDKEYLKKIRTILSTTIKAMGDTVGTNATEDDDNQKDKNKLYKDSLEKVKNILESYLTDVLNDNNTIENIYNKREDLKNTLTNLKLLKVNDSWPKEEKIVTLDSLSIIIKNATTTAASIKETKTYPMYSFEEDPFKKIVTKILHDRKETFQSECVDSIKKLIDKRSTALFFEIKARLDYQDDEPITANLILKNILIKCYLDSRKKIRFKENADKNNSRILNKLFVKNVTVEFEDGTIKNILADLTLTDNTAGEEFGNTLRFKNISPISISTKTDPESFQKIKLFASDDKHFRNKYNLIKALSDSAEPKLFYLKEKRDEINKIKSDSSFKLESDVIYFYLSDLLDYSIIAENDREDYSPANTVVSLNQEKRSVELKKEKRSKILTARAYTDFIGIQNEEPNGLIQIEGSKKINLNTAKHGGAYVYFGFFSYVEPILSFSKIEKNKNAMELNSSKLDQAQLQNGNKSFSMLPINLYKYQKSSFDINLNIWKVNFPELKSNLQINSSIGIFKTNTVDTLSVSAPNNITITADPNFTTLNTLRWGFTAIWEIKPDSRYGICVGWDRRKLNLLTNGFTIPKDEDKNIKLLNTAFVDAFLKTNEDSKLFFRYRFTFDDKSPKENFSQIQLGYLMDLFKTKK